MRKEQNFMMVFRFQPNFEYQPSAAEQEAMQQQWGAFIGQLALQEKLVSTHQLGFEGKQISRNKTVSDGILIAEKETIGGNMVVHAHSLEEAVELAKACPILDMGGSVEVRSIIPMAD